MNDQEIIGLYLNRCEDAIRETDAAYGRQLTALANRILYCQEDSQECVSDTYLKTWETIPPTLPRHFFSYLATICRHYAFGRLDWNNAAKRKAEIVTLTQELELCIPDRQREREQTGRELRQLLNQFLESLPKEHRVIFLARYWYCLSISEIAQRLGCTESKVKTRLHRTREQLKAYLRKEGIAV